MASDDSADIQNRHPHPLVSILSPLKGKKVMKRLTRVMDPRQLRITMTLVTRLFQDFDVVQNYHISESFVEDNEKHEMERHIHVFEEFVLEAVLPALAIAPLPFVSGQLQLLRDPVLVARTRVSHLHFFNQLTLLIPLTARNNSSYAHLYEGRHYQRPNTDVKVRCRRRRYYARRCR